MRNILTKGVTILKYDIIDLPLIYELKYLLSNY